MTIFILQIFWKPNSSGRENWINPLPWALSYRSRPAKCLHKKKWSQPESFWGKMVIMWKVRASDADGYRQNGSKIRQMGNHGTGQILSIKRVEATSPPPAENECIQDIFIQLFIVLFCSICRLCSSRHSTPIIITIPNIKGVKKYLPGSTSQTFIHILSFSFIDRYLVVLSFT